MNRHRGLVPLTLGLLFCSHPVLALDTNTSSYVNTLLAATVSKIKHGHAILQLSGYWNIQGETQDIGIDGAVRPRLLSQPP